MPPCRGGPAGPSYLCSPPTVPVAPGPGPLWPCCTRAALASGNERVGAALSDRPGADHCRLAGSRPRYCWRPATRRLLGPGSRCGRGGRVCHRRAPPRRGRRIHLDAGDSAAL